MFKTFLLAFIALGSIGLAADAEPPVPASAADTVTTLVARHMAEKQLAGMAVAVYDGTKGILLSFGIANKATRRPITSSTIFELGSVTKVFTSTDLALQVLNGNMALSDPVAKYLPALQRGGAIREVTLLDLATHTSSLPRVPPQGKKRGYNYQKLLAYVREWQPDRKIGSSYSYSNLGFGLLGFALANQQKESYETVIQKSVCAPLAMNSTFVQVPKHLLDKYATGYTQEGKPVRQRWQVLWTGSGSLRSTSKDMLRFLEGNLGLRGPEELVKAMQFAQAEHYKGKEITLGLAWQRTEREGSLIIDKNGAVAGFSTYIGMIPDSKVGVVLLSNQRHKGITALGRKIVLALKASAPAPQ